MFFSRSLDLSSRSLALSFFASLSLFLSRLSALRVRWCQPTIPWNRVVSGWLWTLFLSGPSWVTGWVTACLFPCYVAYCLWSNFYFIILALQLSIPRGSEYFQRVVRERKFCMWHTHTTIKKYFISSYMWCSFVILDDRLCYIILRRFAFLTYWSYWFSRVPSTRANKGPPIAVDIYVILLPEATYVFQNGLFALLTYGAPYREINFVSV